jgi:hypothetical protein
MLISAELYTHDGMTKVDTVTGVHFNEHSGRVPEAITHLNRVYTCFYGQSYNNASPLNPPVYREAETQNL